MKVKLDHIAIAYEELKEPLEFFSELLGAERELFRLEDRGLEGASLSLGESSIELLAPTREDTAISNFLKLRGPGIHHICLSVDEFDTFLEKIRDRGISIIEGPKMGAHGRRVVFLNPRETQRVLIEIVEASRP